MDDITGLPDITKILKTASKLPVEFPTFLIDLLRQFSNKVEESNPDKYKSLQISIQRSVLALEILAVRCLQSIINSRPKRPVPVTFHYVTMSALVSHVATRWIRCLRSTALAYPRHFISTVCATASFFDGSPPMEWVGRNGRHRATVSTQSDVSSQKDQRMWMLSLSLAFGGTHVCAHLIGRVPCGWVCMAPHAWPHVLCTKRGRLW